MYSQGSSEKLFCNTVVHGDAPFHVGEYEPEGNSFESTSMQACEADWNLNNIPAPQVSSACICLSI